MTPPPDEATDGARLSAAHQPQHLGKRGDRRRIPSVQSDHPQANTLRLSFVTVPPEKIEHGIALLAQSMQDAAAAG